MVKLNNIEFDNYKKLEARPYQKEALLVVLNFVKNLLK
jgi:hypothetical protein